jgi:hypothetical protein
MFMSAKKDGSRWLLSNGMGHALALPRRDSYAGSQVSIGVVGTGRRAVGLTKTGRPKGIPGQVTALMGEMLAALSRPLYLIDARRNGTGAQSSWSPREFATIIPNFLSAGARYAYLHVPCLAPSIGMLDGDLSSWRDFRREYVKERSDEDLALGQAFVEAAAAEGGMAAFLCAEADHPEFDSLPEGEQNTHYCHRFTLAKLIAGRLNAAYGDVRGQMVHLDVVDFHLQRERGEAYVPRVTVL